MDLSVIGAWKKRTRDCERHSPARVRNEDIERWLNIEDDDEVSNAVIADICKDITL